jgi:hypothetical protein
MQNKHSRRRRRNGLQVGEANLFFMLEKEKGVFFCIAEWLCLWPFCVTFYNTAWVGVGLIDVEGGHSGLVPRGRTCAQKHHFKEHLSCTAYMVDGASLLHVCMFRHTHLWGLVEGINNGVFFFVANVKYKKDSIFEHALFGVQATRARKGTSFSLSLLADTL